MRSKTTSAQHANRASVAALGRELAALDGMTTGELAEKYREVLGVPTRSRNKQYLQHHIAWRIQELAEGGLSARAIDQIERLAPAAPARWRRPSKRHDVARDVRGASDEVIRDPRIPAVGTTFARIHDGAEHRVTVLDHGFEYRGERHRTLSGIARLVTGKSWNGYVFFFGRGQDTGSEHVR